MKCAMDAIYFANGENKILSSDKEMQFWRENISKYHSEFYRLSVKNFDFIVPIPNSGVAYAEGISKETGVPILNLVKKETHKRFLNVDSGIERNFRISKNLTVNKDYELKNKKILIVDEAIFTGFTLKEVIEQVRIAYDDLEIHVSIPNPIVKKNCIFSKFPIRDLLYNNLQSNYFEEYFRVTDVYLQKLDESYYKSFGWPNTCFFCLED